MENVAKLVKLYKSIGALTDCKKLGIIRNQEKQLWEVWGHFQNANGRKNGKVASFADVAEAVEFKRTAI